VCLFTAHLGSGSSPISCGDFLPPSLLQAFPLLIAGWCCCSCWPACLFTAHMGSGSFPLSCGDFLPPPLSQAVPLLVAGLTPPLLLEPLWPGMACLFTVPGRIPFPLSLVLRVPHPLCNVSLLLLLLITQFLFFPRVEVSLSSGLCCSGPGLSVEVLRTAKLTLSTSSQVIWAWATGGPGALLVSPFNVKWRFSVQAGGVEGSKFCLFSVILPATCVSSVSPRFHYRSHAFCFLPLAAVLEFLLCNFLLVGDAGGGIQCLTDARQALYH
jgi:hypothetical protein